MMFTPMGRWVLMVYEFAPIANLLLTQLGVNPTIQVSRAKHAWGTFHGLLPFEFQL
jgi:hypothetical protein